MIYDVIIIGGGASGLACGNVLKEKGLSFVVLERANKAAKKVLATGNGKCNLSNMDIDEKWYNTSFVNDIIKKFPTQAVVHFFESQGIKTKTLDNRVYPYTESSQTVADMLICKVRENIICNYEVKSIIKKDLFIINGNIKGEKIVLATGSNATLGYNSNHLLESFGHKSKPFLPSLVWLETDTKYLRKLSGLRSKGTATLLENGKVIATEEGEVLFKDNGLSGIAIFMLSKYIRKEKGDYTISLDLATDLTVAEVKNYSISGIVKKPIADNVERQAKDLGKATEDTLKNFVIKVKGLADVKYAQVCSGGLKVDDFDKCTLQSKLEKGLYATGEALDIDGQCGGYNLHWAWASGLAVAESITQK